VSAEQIREFQTVPKLFETLERLILDSESERDLNLLRNNKTDGSSAIAKQALTNLVMLAKRASKRSTLVAQNCNNDSTDHIATLEAFIDSIKNICWHLVHIRPTMSSIGNVICQAFFQTFSFWENSAKYQQEMFETTSNEKSSSRSSESSVKSVDSLLFELETNARLKIDTLEKAAANISEHFQNVTPRGSTLLTLSYSGTVMHALKDALVKRNAKIVISESRPTNEGKRTLKELLSILDVPEIAATTANPVEVVEYAQMLSFCTEACIPKLFMAGHITAAVVGADSLLSSGAFINKTGTLLVFQCCAHYHIPCYVLCDQSKIINIDNCDLSKELEQGDFNDLLDSEMTKFLSEHNRKDMFRILNPLFEIIPLVGADIKVITETGFTSIDEIAKLAQQIVHERNFTLN